MSDETPDLSLVATDDLIEELMKRHSATLIVRETDPDDDHRDTYIDYEGGVSTAIGLACRAKRRLLAMAEVDDDNDD